MTVAELERLLATLPGETVVLLNGGHLSLIFRRSGGEKSARVGWTECSERGHPRVPVFEPREHPPTINLSTTIWPKAAWEPAPPVVLSGRWPRASRQEVEG